MDARQLQTSRERVACKVCGRSLLRGEFDTCFRDGTAQHLVCDLCAPRALAKGWVREETTQARLASRLIC